MERSRKIALVAHCLLNVNSRVEGIARYAGVHPLIGELADRGYGIIQLPCPELPVGGCKRWAATIEQYDTPHYREACEILAEEIAMQVREYLRCGYQVGPLIGIDGSPSCGVLETTSGPWGGYADAERYAEILAEKSRVSGTGVFMRSLAARLEPLGVAFVSIDDRDPLGTAGKVLGQLT